MLADSAMAIDLITYVFGIVTGIGLTVLYAASRVRSRNVPLEPKL
jgi:hypothetical protein